MAKHTFRKGSEYFHNDTKAKIMFGKFNADGTATCLNSDRLFITLTRAELENEYTSYSSLEKKKREKRRGQGW